MSKKREKKSFSKTTNKEKKKKFLFLIFIIFKIQKLLSKLSKNPKLHKKKNGTLTINTGQNKKSFGTTGQFRKIRDI